MHNDITTMFKLIRKEVKEAKPVVETLKATPKRARKEKLEEQKEDTQESNEEPEV